MCLSQCAEISMNTCDYLYQEDQSLHKLLIPNDFTNNCIIYPENEYEKWGTEQTAIMKLKWLQ